MNLPPLANFFALRRPVAAERQAYQTAFQESGDFTECFELADNWIVGTSVLLRSAPEPAPARRNRFVFAEGSASIMAGMAGSADEFYANLGNICDSNPEKITHLPGDFSFVRLGLNASILIVRACAGICPMYYYWNEKEIAVGTRLAYFIRYLGLADLDPLVNGAWTSGATCFPDARTHLSEVRIVPRGSFARIDSSRTFSQKRYWNPRPACLPYPSTTEQADHATLLRHLLVSSLERNLDSTGPNLLTLSGGTDSTALAALARGVLHRDVITWSQVPADPELYQREIVYIEHIRKTFGIVRNWEQPHTQECRLKSYDRLPESIFPVVHPALLALPDVLKETKPAVFFGGEFADEVCGSHFTLNDWVDAASAFRLLERLPKGDASIRDLLRLIKQRVLLQLNGRRCPFLKNLADYVAPPVQSEYQEWCVRQETIAQADSYPKYFFALCLENTEYVTMNWEALSPFGIRRLLPFFNREMIELAFSCHPEELVVPGTKRLLRKALQGDVPRKNLDRQDKGSWGKYINQEALFPLRRMPQKLRGILCDRFFDQETTTQPYSAASPLTALATFAKAVTETKNRAKHSLHSLRILKH